MSGVLGGEEVGFCGREGGARLGASLARLDISSNNEEAGGGQSGNGGMLPPAGPSHLSPDRTALSVAVHNAVAAFEAPRQWWGGPSRHPDFRRHLWNVNTYGGAVADDGGVIGASSDTVHGKDLLLRHAAGHLADEQPHPLAVAILRISGHHRDLSLSRLFSFSDGYATSSDEPPPRRGAAPQPQQLCGLNGGAGLFSSGRGMTAMMECHDVEMPFLRGIDVNRPAPAAETTTTRGASLARRTRGVRRDLPQQHALQPAATTRTPAAAADLVYRGQGRDGSSNSREKKREENKICS
uniref:Uncharacterized protein n=1 Tax=Oryza sativa subsp. japonica TaxID=39947 RepID=Q8S5M4_ORYSJ|nr:Hypothetical protein protein similar to DNA-binding proteins [Oryza sativa Japonica Group]